MRPMSHRRRTRLLRSSCACNPALCRVQHCNLLSAWHPQHHTEPPLSNQECALQVMTMGKHVECRASIMNQHMNWLSCQVLVSPHKLHQADLPFCNTLRQMEGLSERGPQLHALSTPHPVAKLTLLPHVCFLCCTCFTRHCLACRANV